MRDKTSIMKPKLANNATSEDDLYNKQHKAAASKLQDSVKPSKSDTRNKRCSECSADQHPTLAKTKMSHLQTRVSHKVLAR